MNITSNRLTRDLNILHMNSLYSVVSFQTWLYFIFNFNLIFGETL